MSNAETPTELDPWASRRTLLEIDDLQVGLASEQGEVKAVRGADMKIAPGHIHGLVGESGSGKSVLALSLMGLLDPGAKIAGRARLRTRAGEEIDLARPESVDWPKVRGAEIGIVFQDPLSSLNPYMRIAEQISEAILAHRDLGRNPARARALELLEEVGMPDAERVGGEYPHELSGGMRQRAMIAIALATGPSLLIADEPTAALDVTTQAAILDLIVELRGRHAMSVLLISHDLALVAERAEVVSVMKEGQIVEHGPVEEVLDQPTDPYTRRLVDSVPSLGSSSGAEERVTRRSGEEPLLEVAGLSKSFGRRRQRRTLRGRGHTRAVDAVDLTLDAGETLGLVGESGSGKTTLLRLIARLIEPSAGSVRFRGEDISRLTRRRMRPIRAAMQMVFQDPYSSLNPRHRIREIVGAPIALHGIASGPELDRRVVRLLERVGLAGSNADRYPHQFSGGQRQRIAIARALGPSPSLLLADEPVSALDVTVQAEILDLLSELREELDLAMVFVSHDLAVVGQVADRIAVMRQGRLIEQGPASQVCHFPSDPYTRRLLDALPRLERLRPPGGDDQSSPRIT